MTERRTKTLFTRTALMILGGVIMTLVVNLLLNALGRWAIETFYMSKSAADAHSRALLLEMQSNVRLIVAWLSFFAFVSTLLFYTHRISYYLRSFSADVSAISSGEAEHVDETRGFRELSGLAADVNHMHDVITERTSSAQEALRSNRELITALSHDIRNPLTSLIGYLDLLGMEAETLTQTQRQYVAACAEKADRIRALTDEMFRYFLIFSDQKPQLQMERFDAQILLQQMIGEQAIELESRGFHIISDPLKQSLQIETDSSMLSRVFENLFSNIRKYADPKDPIMLAARVQDGHLVVTVANTVNASPPNSTESNRIGLRACAVIMEQLNGTFHAGAENGVFTALLTLPVLPEN